MGEAAVLLEQLHWPDIFVFTEAGGRSGKRNLRELFGDPVGK